MELVEIISDYLEGALSPLERSHFEEHLAICTGCTRYLQQMKETINMLGRLTEDTIAPQARYELLSAFREWKRTKQ